MYDWLIKSKWWFLSACDEGMVTTFVLYYYTRMYYTILFSFNIRVNYPVDSIRLKLPITCLNHPQGFVLEPLLPIIICTNYMYNNIKYYNFHTYMYANNTQINCSFMLREINETGAKINTDLDRLSQNPWKSLFTCQSFESGIYNIYGSKNVCSSVANRVKLMIGDGMMLLVDSMKKLGPIMSNTFKVYVSCTMFRHL